MDRALLEAKKIPGLVPYAQRLESALALIQEVTAALLAAAHDQGEEAFLADATLYLELFGIVAIGWQWLLQGVALERALAKELSEAEASFYQGKRATLRYFFHYELPKSEHLARRLREADGLTVGLEEAWFDD